MQRKSKIRLGASTRGARAVVGARRRAAGRVVDRRPAADHPRARASYRPTEAQLASTEEASPDAPDVTLTPEEAEVLAPLVRLWTWRVRQGLPPTVTPRRTPPAAPPPATPPPPAESPATSADPRTKLALMFIERVKRGLVPRWSAS